MNNCRYCNQPIPASEEVVTFSYWSAIKDACHRACKDEGVKREAYECQCVDADCNDCKHFKRIAMIDKGSHRGECLKLNREVFGHPNKWSGLDCFEHRRAESMGELC